VAVTRRGEGICQMAQQPKPRVQPGARRHGIAGIHGNRGNVVSVTYRIQRAWQSSNPTLSAKSKPLFSIVYTLESVVGCKASGFRSYLRHQDRKKQASSGHVGADVGHVGASVDPRRLSTRQPPLPEPHLYQGLPAVL